MPRGGAHGAVHAETTQSERLHSCTHADAAPFPSPSSYHPSPAGLEQDSLGPSHSGKNSGNGYGGAADGPRVDRPNSSRGSRNITFTFRGQGQPPRGGLREELRPAATPPPPKEGTKSSKDLTSVNTSVLAGVVATGLLLSAPVLSSRLIEVLIGQRPDAQFPKLLASITFIYVMEPVMTFFYVKNVCAVGEEVVARLREDLFRALLVQRIEFFDRNQTAKLAATLSVELGTVRTLVAANVSRDRGFRAIGECLGTLAVLWRIAPKLAPVLGFAVVSSAVTQLAAGAPEYQKGLAQLLDWATSALPLEKLGISKAEVEAPLSRIPLGQ